jgi:hypothetical protein
LFQDILRHAVSAKKGKIDIFSLHIIVRNWVLELILPLIDSLPVYQIKFGAVV